MPYESVECGWEEVVVGLRLDIHFGLARAIACLSL
jgi:hypothetical protein